MGIQGSRVISSRGENQTSWEDLTLDLHGMSVGGAQAQVLVWLAYLDSQTFEIEAGRKVRLRLRKR